MSAVEDLQSSTSHPDPVHVTAHFLFPVDTGPCEIHVKPIRAGRTSSNIDADIVQDVSASPCFVDVVSP